MPTVVFNGIAINKIITVIVVALILWFSTRLSTYYSVFYLPIIKKNQKITFPMHQLLESSHEAFERSEISSRMVVVHTRGGGGKKAHDIVKPIHYLLHDWAFTRIIIILCRWAISRT